MRDTREGCLVLYFALVTKGSPRVLDHDVCLWRREAGQQLTQSSRTTQPANVSNVSVQSAQKVAVVVVAGLSDV